LKNLAKLLTLVARVESEIDVGAGAAIEFSPGGLRAILLAGHEKVNLRTNRKSLKYVGFVP
jgi:hypothetical protein